MERISSILVRVVVVVIVGTRVKFSLYSLGFGSLWIPMNRIMPKKNYFFAFCLWFPSICCAYWSHIFFTFTWITFFSVFLDLTLYNFLFSFTFNRCMWFITTISNIIFVSINWCCNRSYSLQSFSIGRTERYFAMWIGFILHMFLMYVLQKTQKILENKFNLARHKNV